VEEDTYSVQEAARILRTTERTVLRRLEPASHQQVDGEQHRHDDPHEEDGQQREWHVELLAPFLCPA
jgi:hypothetical protein